MFEFNACLWFVHSVRFQSMVSWPPLLCCLNAFSNVSENSTLKSIGLSYLFILNGYRQTIGLWYLFILNAYIHPLDYQLFILNGYRQTMTGWWFQTFFIFHNIWDNPSHWLSYVSRWLLHHQPDDKAASSQIFRTPTRQSRHLNALSRLSLRSRILRVWLGAFAANRDSKGGSHEHHPYIYIYIHIYIYIFKRLRATAGQGPNYVGPWCGYVGVCWPILRAMWAHLVAMLAYVGFMLTHVEPKDPKNGNRKKNTVKRRIFWWSAAYLGAMWAHLGAMLAYLEGNVGPSWGYVGPSWGYVSPSWDYDGPSWGYLDLSWGHVGPSWGPCWPIWSHKIRKVAKSGALPWERRRRMEG